MSRANITVRSNIDIPLEKINDFISSHCLNLDITDAQYAELREKMGQGDDQNKDSFIDFTKTRLRRIFNNSSFDQGGRFYGGWWQQIPSDYRVFLTIDKKKTGQYDFAGMHFSMLYAEKGVDTPMDDPYALQAYPPRLRSAIKKAFNILINCASPTIATRAIDSRIEDGELPKELGSGKQIIDAFIETHPLLEDSIASGAGIHAQFTDSHIAEIIMLKGIDLGMCILPIHDGFISTAGDHQILAALMEDAFKEVTGHPARISPEDFDLTILPHAGKAKTYWVGRKDGTTEVNGPIEGNAVAYSAILDKEHLWNRLEEDTLSKAERDRIENECIQSLVRTNKQRP